METTIKLQESFSYASLPVIIFGLLAALGIIYYLVKYIRNKALSRKKKPEIKNVGAGQIEKLKTKYIAELEKIENDFKSNKINIRQAYQKLSVCVRKFVHGATGINTQSCTLKDIKTLNMPRLEELIEEYYEPEFASKSAGDVNSSIIKTKKVIKEWK